MAFPWTRGGRDCHCPKIGRERRTMRKKRRSIRLAGSGMGQRADLGSSNGPMQGGHPSTPRWFNVHMSLKEVR